MKAIPQNQRKTPDMSSPGKLGSYPMKYLNNHLKRFQDILLRKKDQEPELQAMITHHPNGLIVVQLNQPLQSLFLSAEEATAIARALLLEARRVRILLCNQRQMG